MVEKHTSKARLLIADDNSEIRDVLCDLLSVDYECRMVGSAEEALALLSVTEFNLYGSHTKIRIPFRFELPFYLAKA